MTQKNVPALTPPTTPGEAGDSTTNAKASAETLDGQILKGRGGVLEGPPRSVVPRPGTPTAFTPVGSVAPGPPPNAGPYDGFDEDDDDAPTMGPTPLLDLDAEMARAPASYRPPPPPPPSYRPPAPQPPTPPSPPMLGRSFPPVPSSSAPPPPPVPFSPPPQPSIRIRSGRIRWR